MLSSAALRCAAYLPACREEGGAFRFSIPLSELVGVDLCPTVLITVHSDRAARRVTLVGTRAALGSPEVDAVSLKAVLGVEAWREERAFR